MPPKEYVAVRLDSSTASRIDALKDSLSTPWRPATRSETLRAVILMGLDLLEGGQNKKRGARRKARRT